MQAYRKLYISIVKRRKVAAREDAKLGLPHSFNAASLARSRVLTCTRCGASYDEQSVMIAQVSERRGRQYDENILFCKAKYC
jgi:hypothetical protein